MNKIKLLITSVVLTAAMSITAFAGQWKQDSIGWWYQNDDGSFSANVIKQIGGPWYYFDGSGYMKIGDYQLSDGWYNFREDGTCSNPLGELDGAPVGAPAAGWVRYSGTITSTMQEITDGRVVFYNNMYWSSPDYVNNLKKIADKDTVTRTPTKTLQPGTIVNFDEGTYTNDDDE